MFARIVYETIASVLMSILESPPTLQILTVSASTVCRSCQSRLE